jgi:hypothetical protein
MHDDFWSYIWQVVGVIVVLAILALSVTFISVDKKVDGYYMSHGSGGQTAGSCVWAHWTWHPDELAFCTEDYNKAIDFMTKANAGIKR